jgi:D-lyxose ketol-isomerase
MKSEDAERARGEAARMLADAGIVIAPAEQAAMEVVDFGLDDADHYAIEVVIYENNERYCAKELILLPRRICPEHRHPPVPGRHPGKQETFRCRSGEVYLNVAGPATPHPKARVPKKDEPFFTVHHEIVLRTGDQYTLPPDSLHWFQSGEDGAIVSEFSTTNTDEYDLWTNPAIRRLPDAE